MALYSLFIPILLVDEGYWAKIKGDKGGETFVGISRVFNPTWSGFPLIDAYKSDPNFPKILKSDPILMTKVHVFYKTNKWDALHLDMINNQSVANFIMDWCINSDMWVPVHHAQKILNLPQVDNLGPRTIAAINQQNEDFFNEMKAARAQFYQDVVTANPTDVKFLPEWLRRNNSFQYAA